MPKYAIEKMFAATISLQEATEIYEKMPEVLQSFIQSRVASHGIPATELLQKIPRHLLDNNIEIFKFIKSKDISHIIATSKGGSPINFNNWIFEDMGPNRSRGNDPMGFEEYLQAQLDNNVDAMGIEFGTADPGSPGYNAAFKQAFNIESDIEIEIDPELMTETLNNASVTSDGLWEGMGEALTEIGIPVGYLTFKVGFGGVIPFLKSIDWKKFLSSSQYRNKTLTKAFVAFRRGGWKQTAKAFVVGFLISVFPPLAYFMSAVGLTGLAAMGTRWLANKVIKVNGPLGNFLYKVSSILDGAHQFLKNVLNSFEKIIDVVIESASNVAKRIVKVGAEFLRQVRAVTKEIAQEVTAKASKFIQDASSKLSGWIFSWFGKTAVA